MSLYNALMIVCAKYLNGSLSVLRDVLFPACSNAIPLTSLLPTNIDPNSTAASTFSVMEMIQVNGVPLTATIQQMFDLYMKVLLEDIVRYINMNPERRHALAQHKQTQMFEEQMMSTMLTHTRGLAESRMAQWTTERKSLYDTIAQLQGEVMFYQHKAATDSSEQQHNDYENTTTGGDEGTTQLDPMLRSLPVTKHVPQYGSVVVILDVDGVEILWNTMETRDTAHVVVKEYGDIVAQISSQFKPVLSHDVLGTTHFFVFVDIITAAKFAATVQSTVRQRTWPPCLPRGGMYPRILMHHLRTPIPLPFDRATSFADPHRAQDVRSAAKLVCLASNGDTYSTFQVNSVPGVKRLCTFKLIDSFVTTHACAPPHTVYQVTLLQGGSGESIPSPPPTTTGMGITSPPTLHDVLRCVARVERMLSTLGVVSVIPRGLPPKGNGCVLVAQVSHLSTISEQYDVVAQMVQDLLFVLRRTCGLHDGIEFVSDRACITEYPHTFAYCALFDDTAKAFLCARDLQNEISAFRWPMELTAILSNRKIADPFGLQIGLCTGAVSYDVRSAAKAPMVPLFALHPFRPELEGSYLGLRGPTVEKCTELCHSSSSGEVTVCPASYHVLAGFDFSRKHPDVKFEPRGNAFTYSKSIAQAILKDRLNEMFEPVKHKPPVLAIPVMETTQPPAGYAYLTCLTPEGIQYMVDLYPDMAQHAVGLFLTTVHMVLARTNGKIIDVCTVHGTCLVAHANAVSAVMCSLTLHQELMCAAWTSDVLRLREAAEFKLGNGTIIFKGLRAKIGIVGGDTFKDVLGNALLLCAAARGGDTLISRSIFELIYHRQKDLQHPYLAEDRVVQTAINYQGPVFRIIPQGLKPRLSFVHQKAMFEDTHIDLYRTKLAKRFEVRIKGLRDLGSVPEPTVETEEAERILMSKVLQIRFFTDTTTQLLKTDKEESEEMAILTMEQSQGHYALEQLAAAAEDGDGQPIPPPTVPFSPQVYQVILRCFQAATVGEDLAIPAAEVPQVLNRIKEVGVQSTAPPAAKQQPAPTPPRTTLPMVLGILYPTTERSVLESAVKVLGVPRPLKKATPTAEAMKASMQQTGGGKQQIGGGGGSGVGAGMSVTTMSPFVLATEKHVRDMVILQERIERDLRWDIFCEKLMGVQYCDNIKVLEHECHFLRNEVQRLAALTENCVSVDELNAVKKAAALDKHTLTARATRLSRSMLQAHYSSHMFAQYCRRYLDDQVDIPLSDAQLLDDWVALMSGVVGDTFEPTIKVPYIVIRNVSEEEDSASKQQFAAYQPLLRQPAEVDLNTDSSQVVVSMLTVLGTALGGLKVFRDRYQECVRARRLLQASQSKGNKNAQKQQQQVVKEPVPTKDCASQCDLAGNDRRKSSRAYGVLTPKSPSQSNFEGSDQWLGASQRSGDFALDFNAPNVVGQPRTPTAISVTISPVAPPVLEIPALNSTQAEEEEPDQEEEEEDEEEYSEHDEPRDSNHIITPSHVRPTSSSRDDVVRIPVHLGNPFGYFPTSPSSGGGGGGGGTLSFDSSDC
eukprot:PhF_6_TR31818/c0_g1_i1/m.47004